MMGLNAHRYQSSHNAIGGQECSQVRSAVARALEFACATLIRSNCGRQSRSNSTGPSSRTASPGPSLSEIYAVSSMPRRTGNRRKLQPPHQELHHLLELSLPDPSGGDRQDPRGAQQASAHDLSPFAPVMGVFQHVRGVRLLQREAAGQHRCPAPKICAQNHPGQLGAAKLVKPKL